MVKYLNFIVPFEKKELEHLFFLESVFNWTIFFQVAWFQCPQYCKPLFMFI